MDGVQPKKVEPKVFKKQVLTGQLVYQFDDDEPVSMGAVTDNKSAEFRITSIAGDAMIFIGDGGKQMKLWIRPAVQSEVSEGTPDQK